ncbi:MAG: sulfite exporter TauE/SafE family protein [Candidatus Bathyarchaeia archaeon]
MTLPSEVTNPFFEAFVVGILYGLTFCTSSCLPYIASYIAGTGADFRKSVIITLTYNVGRITAYASIGAILSLLSGTFRLFIDEKAMALFREYSSYAFGIITIAVGLSLLQKNRAFSSGCISQGKKQPAFTSKYRRLDVQAFLLGLSRGLVICPPLVLLLSYSVPFEVPAASFAIALLFGIGTALSPLLLLGGVTGWLLSKAPLFSKWLHLGGAAFLILLGASTIITSVLATCA